MSEQNKSLIRRAFLDIRFTIIDQNAEGERVVTHWTAQGNHQGEFKGIPATGKQFNMRAIDIDCNDDSKVLECWTSLDELGLLQQFGILPTVESMQGISTEGRMLSEDQSFLGA